jgi:hypothetical protein
MCPAAGLSTYCWGKPKMHKKWFDDRRGKSSAAAAVNRPAYPAQTWGGRLDRRVPLGRRADGLA